MKPQTGGPPCFKIDILQILTPYSSQHLSFSAEQDGQALLVYSHLIRIIPFIIPKVASWNVSIALIVTNDLPFSSTVRGPSVPLLNESCLLFEMDRVLPGGRGMEPDSTQVSGRRVGLLSDAQNLWGRGVSEGQFAAALLSFQGIYSLSPSETQ